MAKKSKHRPYRSAHPVRARLAENLETLIKRTRIGFTGGPIGKNMTADFAGVSRSQMYDILAATKGATTDTLDKFAEHFGVDAYRLLRKGARA